MTCSRKISTAPHQPDPPLHLGQARMKRTADNLVLILNEYLPAGCFEWLAERTDIGSVLAVARERLDAAVISCDRAEFVAAVQNLTARYQGVPTVYQQETMRAQKGAGCPSPNHSWMGPVRARSVWHF